PSFTLIAADQLSASADAQLSLFGFVVAAGHVTIDKTTANGSGLTNADALGVSLTNASAFVGVGGGFDDHGTAGDFSDDTISTTGGIGLLVTVPSFKLALVTTAGAKYTAFQLDDLSGSLLGIDGLVFNVSGLDLKLNQAKAIPTGLDTTRLDWSSVSFAGSGAPHFTLTGADQLSLSADAQLSLFGFVVAAGHVTIDKTTANGSGLTNADALVVSLTNTSAFVGVGGGFDDHGTAGDFSDDTISTT